MECSSEQMTRRKALGAMVLGMGGALLTACSPAPPATAPASAAASSTTASSPAAVTSASSTGSTTLLVWPFNYKTHLDAWKQMQPDFEKKTSNVKLQLEPQDNPFGKIPAGAAAGNLPDVFEDMGKMSPPLITGKVIQAIDDLVYKPAKLDPSAAFFPGAQVAFEYSGKMYGVPLEDNHVGWSIFTRMDDWNTAGLPFPANREFADWDAFYEMAQKLVKKDSSRNVVEWGYQEVNGWCVAYVMQGILEQGANYWDDAKQQFTFESDAGIKAITKIVSDPVFQNQIEGDTLGTDSNGNILKHKVATIQGTNQIIPLAKVDYPDLVIDGALHPPMGSKWVTVSEGGWGYMLNAKPKQLDAAVALLTYLTTLYPQSVWTQAVGAQPPALRAVAKEKFWEDPINVVGKKQLSVQDKGIYMTQGKDLGMVTEMQNRWMAIASDLRAKKITVEAAAKRADQEFAKQRDDFLKKYGS